MRRGNLARLFLILLVALANNSLAQEAKQITCSGRVVDARGRPIVGAEVVAYEMVFDAAGNVKLRFIGQAITKADGAFVFETTSRSNGRSLGAVIVARSERLALGWADWNMDSDSQFAIELGEPTRIEGTVTDGAGGAIANAEVRAILFKPSTSGTMREWLPAIAPLEWLLARSDREGRFGFSNIPSGVEVDLLVSAAGRATIYTYQFGTGPRFTAGQTGIKVTLPSEARIAGRLVDKSTGKGVPKVTLAVVPDFSPAFFVRFLCVSKEDGSFDIGGLQTGRYLIRNGIARTYVEVESGKTTSDVMIECPAVLQGRVTGPGGRPLADVEVQIRGKETLGERAIAGANIKTDEDGHYRYLEIDWPYVVGFLWSEDIPGGRGQRSQYLRLHQLFEGGQTVDFQFREFPEGTAGLGVQVTDQHGHAVGDFVVDTRNTVDWKDYSRDLYQYCYQYSPTTTDGTFKLSNLPGGVYWVHCLPRGELKGYKFPERRQVTLEEGKTTNITCQVLKKTARYGRILFEDGTPAIADIPWSGAGEEISVSSAFGDNDSPVDKEGYFIAYLTDDEIERVKGGKAQMEISYPRHDDPHTRYAVGIFPGELLSRDKSAAGVVKIPKPIYKRRIDLINAPSLVGGPLPELKDLKIELSGADVDDKIVLVCFWDMDQRPSRNCIIQLAKQAEQLKEEGVTVVAVQASKVDPDTLNEWVKKNNISFLVGMVQGDEKETRFAWGVKSLPWLILTDKQHIVTAEGLRVDDLEIE